MLLCIAAALVNQATTRRVPDRHRAVLQAFAFLQEYSKHRKNPQASAAEAGKRGWLLGWLDAQLGLRAGLLLHSLMFSQGLRGSIFRKAGR